MTTVRKTPLRRRNIPCAIWKKKNPNLLTKIVDRAINLFALVFRNQNFSLETNEEPQNKPSTPMLTSRVLEEEIASPAELPKAYMGSRPSKVPLRRDLLLHNNATAFFKSPNTLIGSTGFKNGFTTPTSLGRSAMYSMIRTQYARSPSTFTQKGITSSYGREEALTSSQYAFQQGRKMALKRRSSILDDDIGSGGPLRRTRPKASLLPLRDKRELRYTAPKQPDYTSQRLLLMNKSEPKIVKGAEQNRDTSMHGLGSVSGYANVPTKSTQTATKILQHVENMLLKEKSSGSTKSPTKRPLDMLYGQALWAGSYPHDNQKSDVHHHERLHDSRELTSKGEEEVEDNGSRKFPITCNMMSSVNGDLLVTSKDDAPAVKINEPPLQLPAEPPQKKRAFHMSVPESDSFEIDDDETQVNGHMSLLLVESNKQETALAADIVKTSILPGVSRTPALVEPPRKKCAFQMSAPEDDSFEIDDVDETQVNGHASLLLAESNKQETTLAADIVATSTLPGVSRTPALVENNKQMFPEVVKVLEQAEPKESDKHVSSPKIVVGFGGSDSEQGLGFKLTASPPLTTNTHNNLLPQATLPMDNVVPEKDSKSFPLFGTSAERVSPFAFSANGLSDSKPSRSSDPKALQSTSVSNSDTTNGHAKLRESNKVENGNDQKSANIFGEVESNKTGSGRYQQPSNIFGFSSQAVTSTSKNQLQASIFNGSHTNTQASVAVTPSVPFLFGYGTTSIPSSTSGTSLFLSPAFTIGTSSSFGISSMTTSSEGKYGNSTSGPATSIFSSTWDPEKSSGFCTTYNDHMSMDNMDDSMQTSTPVFDESVDSMVAEDTHVFGTGATTNNYDHMSMDTMVADDIHVFGNGATTNNYDYMSMDSMVEDCMQTSKPVPAFGQTFVASPPFTFDSGTQPPLFSYALDSAWWPAKTNYWT